MRTEQVGARDATGVRGSGARPPATGVWRGERGMVTVELAFAGLFAALVTIALAMLAGVGILVARCHETAAEVARQEARADAAAVARALADRPTGALVDVRRSGKDVIVTVSAEARPWGTVLPAVPVSARAVVLREGG